MLVLGMKRDYSAVRKKLILKHFIFDKPTQNTNNSSNNSHSNYNTNTTQNTSKHSTGSKTDCDDFKDYNIK